MVMNMSDSQSDKAFEAVSETMRSLQEQEEIEMEQHYQRALYQANQSSLASYLFGALMDSPLPFGQSFLKDLVDKLRHK
jgi:hypothetical protein